MPDTTHPKVRVREKSPATASQVRKCTACGAEASSAFCPECGEQRPGHGDLSVVHWLGHAAGDLFHLDSRIFRSGKALILHPGRLTAEYFRGCRKPYMQPLSLFLAANLLFFLALPLVGWDTLTTPLNVHLSMMPYSRTARKLATARAEHKHVTLPELVP